MSDNRKNSSRVEEEEEEGHHTAIPPLSITVPPVNDEDEEEDYGEVRQSGTAILSQHRSLLSLSSPSSSSPPPHMQHYRTHERTLPPWMRSSSSSSPSPSPSPQRTAAKKQGATRRRKKKKASSTTATANSIRLSQRTRSDDDDDDGEEDDEYEEEVTDSQFQRELQEIQRGRRRRSGHLTPQERKKVLGPAITICISGIQNPERAQIRKLAAEMGARYSANWDRHCTHLLCALGNTPKLADARLSNAWIVRKEWVMECHRRGIRVPEKQFDFDRPQIVLSNDEEEEEEEQIEGESSNEEEEEDFAKLDPDEGWVPTSDHSRNYKTNNKRKRQLASKKLGFDDLSDSDDNDHETNLRHGEHRMSTHKRQKRAADNDARVEKRGKVNGATEHAGNAAQFLDDSVIAADVRNLLQATKGNTGKVIQEITSNALRHTLQHGSLSDKYLDDWNYDNIRVPKSIRMIILKHQKNASETSFRPCTISVLRQRMLEELHEVHQQNNSKEENMPGLPSPLEGVSIVLGRDIAADRTQCKRMNRIGNFLGADIYTAKPDSQDENMTVTHLLTNNVNVDKCEELGNAITSTSPYVQTLRPEWLDQCMQQGTYIDEEKFTIRSLGK